MTPNSAVFLAQLKHRLHDGFRELYRELMGLQLQRIHGRVLPIRADFHALSTRKRNLGSGSAADGNCRSKCA